MTEDDINDLIDECIDNLADDNILVGATSLQELAIAWAKAGLTLESFLDIRQFIINQASERTDALFIQEKLKLSETQLKRERIYVRSH